MTRQCAWCNRYISFQPSATYVTHGICERCTEQIRLSLPAMKARPPQSTGILHVTKVRLRSLLHLR